MKLLRSLCLGAAVISGFLAASSSAFAHHSFAMFDQTKHITLVGVVKEFQWANPHSWIQILVPDGADKQKEWAIELGSPNMMQRSGWKSSALKPGDKISLVMRPMRDGSPTGSLVSVTLPDGRVLGPGGPPPPSQPVGKPAA